ncbi:hypothetical protein Sango_2154600 [Sesamum angolense]|uniref:Uncharacterized protein n=1 Tax=Sesamum angolense TaxID=2727404 RepID=A0AAE1WCN6_9LAMI|nr:hypothetical protein Sango_2154600 [Sesamum angolense]
MVSSTQTSSQDSNSTFSLKELFENKMANLHVRSNSLPSKSHPIVNDVEDQLCRLRSSEGTSTSATSVTANLASLRDLHEGINNLIQMPQPKEALCHGNSEKWTNELLEGSLGLVDLCGFARDILSLTKGSVQDLQSSIRRNRGETATADDINAYMTSRKKINKMVKKFIKNFKNFDQNCTQFLKEDSDVKAIAGMLKETEAFDFSVLNSLLTILSGEKGRSKIRSWSFLSKFTQTSRMHSERDQECGAEELCLLNLHKLGKNMDITAVQDVLKQLKASEMTIQELEEDLESFFRSLVKTRVSLLNALNH